MNFNRHKYDDMISDEIHDAFYSDQSLRGRIASLRAYAEIVVRKILDIDESEQITLGNHKIRERLEQKNPLLYDKVNKIRLTGNDGTHTQHINKFTENQFNDMRDALFWLYAYLFIDFFQRNPMNENLHALIYSQFSLLPPIIRYDTLSYIFKHGQQNIYVADRLSMAVLKTYDSKRAFEWIEKNKKSLLAMKYPNREIIGYAFKVMEKDQFNNWIRNVPTDAYQLCTRRISKLSIFFKNHRKYYTTLEQAKLYYKNYRLNDETVPGLNELHELMDFVFQGRNIDTGSIDNQLISFSVFDN